MDLSTDPFTDHPAETVHTTHHTILDQISETIADMRAAMKIIKTGKVSRDNNRSRGYQQNTRYDQRNGFQNRYDNNQDRNRFDNRRRPNKYQHHRNQPRTQVIFKYTNQNPLELMQTVRNFINFMKAHPSSREQFKTNKISPHNFNNEVNESEIHASSLQQVQQLINEDTDLVFNTLVAADYIDKSKCTDGSSQHNA